MSERNAVQKMNKIVKRLITRASFKYAPPRSTSMSTKENTAASQANSTNTNNRFLDNKMSHGDSKTESEGSAENNTFAESKETRSKATGPALCRLDGRETRILCLLLLDHKSLKGTVQNERRRTSDCENDSTRNRFLKERGQSVSMFAMRKSGCWLQGFDGHQLFSG